MIFSSASSLLLLAAGVAAVSLNGNAENAVQLSKRAVAPGTIVTQCTTPGVVALTFDDGPYIYTDEALNLLNAAGFKATFFMNGQNWGNIESFASTVKRVVNEGHQMGSHTYNHVDLTTTDTAGIKTQLVLLEEAMMGIVDRRPTWFRAPYLGLNSFVTAELAQLGYKIAGVSVETNDWALQSDIASAADNFEAGLDAGGTIVLAHDVHQNTVELLLPQMISILQSRGLRAVTVGECVGEPASSWYATSPRGASSSSTTSSSTTTSPTSTKPTTSPTSTKPTTSPTSTKPTTSPTSTKPTTSPTSTKPTSSPTSTKPSGTPTPTLSPDWSCGPSVNYKCPGTNCCSQYGWCGTGTAYCAAGCQKPFGRCN